MTRLNDVGVIGLGVMGANLSRNLARHGFSVGVFDSSVEGANRAIASHPEANLDLATSLAELLQRLRRPRKLIALVPAGEPVDALIHSLDALLEEGDLLVDAGNSHFHDTDRRIARTVGRSWRFLGMGLSGGAQGALTGPAMMPGGDPEVRALLRPILEPIAAVGVGGPAAGHCGRGSAGHFVKMVHNGIEYAEMQLLAETAFLLERGLGLEPEAVAAVFEDWNHGELGSFLLEITRDIYRFEDPEQPGKLLLHSILDCARQKGTGRWTVAAATDLGVSIPTLATAVDARLLSTRLELRRRASAQWIASNGLAPSQVPCPSFQGISLEQIAGALYAAKVAAYSQGFALLAEASSDNAYAYSIRLPEVARIWTSGCILRGAILTRVREALDAMAAGSPLWAGVPVVAFAPAFLGELRQRESSWRQVVAAALLSGLPVPGLASSLGWFDTLVTARGSAALIQAQRDYFGEHHYERTDRPGKAHHTDWACARGPYSSKKTLTQ